uniref:Ion_trans_2 domain-containing protein n=1 Tax=Heterorhabditis bacteriophora TaxID=37862 RepID=A0A1I7WX86_HETBA
MGGGVLHRRRSPLVMWSSPILLSLSSVFALLGLTLVGIAVVTDNWTEYQDLKEFGITAIFCYL